MVYRALHNRWLRVLAAVLGALIGSAAVNVFIVPLGFYTGGLMGFCQIARTLLHTSFGITAGKYDLAGIFYFVLNVPILLYAYKTLGRGMVFRTIICTVAYSVFFSVIPIPAKPVIDDMLTSCLLGGILSGIGSGIILTSGCSGGGLDVIGLILSKRGSHITVGKFSLSVNTLLYALCLFLFTPAVAIYSAIYNVFASFMVDRMHQQTVSVQAMIFTREDETDLANYIINTLGRSVTYWNGTGAYTGELVHVLFVCLSKYEIDELRHMVQTFDPHAFLVVQEGVRVDGNFPRRLD